MRAVRFLDLAVKLALAALLVAAVLYPDLSGIKGKASTARLVVYPLGALAVPLWWWAYGRRPSARTGRGGFPPQPGLLTAGVLLAWAPRAVSGAVVVVTCSLAFGTGLALLWELGEYVAFVRGWPELATAYTDTLGDLSLGTLGALLAPPRR